MNDTNLRFLLFLLKVPYNIIYKIYLILIENKQSKFHKSLKSNIFLKFDYWKIQKTYY